MVSNSPISTPSLAPLSSGASPIPTRLDFIGTSQTTIQGDCQVGWVVHPSGKAFPLKCGKWECRTCGPRKGRKVCARLKKNEAVLRLSRVLTLPFAIGVNRTWKQAIEDSGCILNRFLTSLRKVSPGIRYFWVREIGRKSNMVHFHVLIDRYLPKSLLSRWWATAGGGYIVDIHQLRSSPSYVWKYLVKYQELTAEVYRALRGKRRYSCARGLLLVLPKCSTWQGSYFSPVKPWVLAQYYLIKVVDGVYYFYGGPNGLIRECDGG